jgi:hypothetical protein
MKYLFAIVAILVVAFPVSAQDSLTQQIAQLRADQQAYQQSVNAAFAAQKADIVNLDTKLQAVSDKLDAFIQASKPGTTFTTPVSVGGWSTPGQAVLPNTSSSLTIQQSTCSGTGCSAGASRRVGLLGRLRGW